MHAPQKRESAYTPKKLMQSNVCDLSLIVQIDPNSAWKPAIWILQQAASATRLFSRCFVFVARIARGHPDTGESPSHQEMQGIWIWWNFKVIALGLVTPLIPVSLRKHFGVLAIVKLPKCILCIHVCLMRRNQNYMTYSWWKKSCTSWGW